MPHNPTPEQSAIISAVAAPQAQSLFVEAGAGCAKSTTIQMAAKGVKGAALALAFNKSTADGLKAAMPPHILAKTFNGLGHGALLKGALKGTNVKLDDRKVGKITTQVLKDEKKGQVPGLWEQIMGTVKTAMERGLRPDEPTDKDDFLPAAQSNVFEAADGPEVAALARRVLSESNKAAFDRGEIGFADQIYLSLTFGGAFTKFSTIIVDENQDLNSQNHEMIRRSLTAGGRLIAVGDRHQSIYGFRGAVGDSAERLKDLVGREAAQELPLMTTFRCPRLVVERQQFHVPGFRAVTGAKEGKIIRPTAEDRSWSWKWLQTQFVPGTQAVLCRNNAPLISLALKLLASGHAVQMSNRDIGKTLIGLVKKIAPTGETTLLKFFGMVQAWADKETTLALSQGQDSKAGRVRDQADCLIAVAQSMGPSATSGDVEARLRDLFSVGNGVVLSTIHGAKGLEWNNVVHLDYWRVPSKKAEGAELEQEKNLKYVAETRTREVLALVSLEGFRLPEEA